jgi:NCS1 family nucleobase:cation symporter-1
VAEIMVTDYFLLRETKLDSYSLYRRGGMYEDRNGLNPVAIVALVVGVFAALVDKFVLRVAFFMTMLGLWDSSFREQSIA